MRVLIETDSQVTRSNIVFGGLLVGLLTLTLAFAPRPAHAEASSLTVGISASPSSVTLGGSTRVSVRVSGASSDELATASIAIQGAAFPYRKFKTLQTVAPASSNQGLRVTPAINTRYRAVVSLGDGSKIQTRQLTVYVEPIRGGDRYVDGPNSVRYSGARETYSRELAKRWFRVPLRLRTIYFYQQCQGSKNFVLRAKRRAKTRVNESRMTLTFPGFTFQGSACGQRGYGVLAVGISKLPGFLSDGDDGAGRPNSTVKGYRLWRSVAGDRRVSAAIFRRIGFI